MPSARVPVLHTLTRWPFILALSLASIFLFVLIAIRLVPARLPGVADVMQEPATPAEETALAAGKRLYANYCSACHGEKGDGNGPAAKFLNPKPRNFGEGKFRLVSTVNRRPTDQDLLRVLERGMPGSAMFPFAHLSEADRQALVAYVHFLETTAFVERSRREAAEQGEEIDSEELARNVKQVLQPGAALAVAAELPPSRAEAATRGRDLYTRQCASCHGTTGKGDGAQEQKNDDGTPTRPRDFGRGIFKGGREHPQLYTRILLGMPGSPMPSSLSSMKPSEANDLIAYIWSLSDPTSQAKVEQKRTQLSARHLPTPLPNEIAEELWQSAPATRIVVSPLWWRDYEEPDLHVQAMHDGRVLAVRLNWQDRTCNAAAVRPQDFEDMAALQLFKGSPEPFLGMGAADQSVDVWHWRAGWHGNPTTYADVDSQYPNMGVDLYPFEQAGTGSRPHASENQPRAYITARAAGNLRSDPLQNFTGNSLEAKGFGTLTMRPRVSQLVNASGKWQDGRWTVVLRRPLDVSPDAGLQLVPGDRLSIAFAIWDGAARDRNGQKLVSVWHDLRVER
jgi:mono/diheme cytochrome c family protein